ncbi:hypothetical protein FSC12_01850 [Acinetobacter schindleri]|uniref:hypothetical protein n=1 Tax=Acinetobacter schindleri TaxID=108981 RepID=UPI0013B07A3F|nr:hypothetical protein [Acinetobacter schindleri]QIC60180.1 hypothetical protein FSC12_01850 [Acinetobacter schindleri]
MRKQANTIIQSFSIPEDTTDRIDDALYKYRRTKLNQKTSRSKFVSLLIEKGLAAMAAGQ